MSVKQASAFVLDGQGGASLVSFEKALQVLEEGEKLVWIRLYLEKAKPLLKKIKAISSAQAELLCQEETRPRTLVMQDALIAVVRGLNVMGEAPLEDMPSIRGWFGSHLMVTVQRRPVLVLDELVLNFQNGNGSTSVPDFLFGLLEGITLQVSDEVCRIDDELDQAEDALTGSEININAFNLKALRRKVIMLRRHLLPQREAIVRIPVEKLSWLNESHAGKVREILEANIRILEDLDAERERATVLSEERFTIAQEQLNTRMYILAVIAVIFLPLSFVTGLLGVNLGGIPGNSFKYGFEILCILLLGVGAIQLWFLKKFKWL